MKNVLVLYHGLWIFTSTVRDFVESFGKYSRHNVHYLHVDSATDADVDFDAYDVVVLTYTCRLCYPEYMSAQVRRKFRDCPGLKVAFLQDEYEATNDTRAAIRNLNIRLVFTCVPEDKIAWVYPPAMFPGVKFVRVLTGYVPDRFRGIPPDELTPLGDRRNWIGYRGRNIGFNYGDLAFHKIEIGRRFQEACRERDVPCDIAWSEEARLYQNSWLAFLSNCRAVLATPSGSNVFDWDGTLYRRFRRLLEQRPDISYEEYRPQIAERELQIDMEQVSPRIFEAVAVGAVSIVLEGGYSSVLTPGIDCIVVRKDYSNVGDVIEQLADVNHLQLLADRARRNVLDGDRWSYRAFIRVFDAEIDSVERASGRRRNVADPDYFRTFQTHDQILLRRESADSPRQRAMSCCLDLKSADTPSTPHRTASTRQTFEIVRAMRNLSTSLVRRTKSIMPAGVKRRVKKALHTSRTVIAHLRYHESAKRS